MTYAELHCVTNYSFLRGASHPEELVRQAFDLGYTALAITDENSLAGVVRAHVAAKEVGLKLLIGAEIHVQDGAPIVLWAIDRAGYGQLSRLITVGRRRAPKGACWLSRDDVAGHATGLLAGLPLARAETMGERGQDWGVAAEQRGSVAAPVDAVAYELCQWREVFGERLSAIVELHHGPADAQRFARWRQLGRELSVPLVAGNDVHYHERQRRYLQDVLAATRRGCTVRELGGERLPNSDRCLLPLEELRTIFQGQEAVLERTTQLAQQCHFSLDELRYDYPEELCPAGETSRSYLARLTWAGARDRYPQGIPAKVETLLTHELQLIGELNYETYFLTVWDLVRFARSQGILCQGRGSAANSAVCFCLGVTSVDPERIDVLFERFMSKERAEAPDIDVDFEHQRREEVLQYIYEKYGRERAGMTAEVIAYRPRSAVRDVGQALGLSADRIDALAKAVDHVDDVDQLSMRFRETGFDPASRVGRQLLWLVQELMGFPRHLSQHVGGMVLTQRPLCELVPIENAAMLGRTVIQWDKNDLDALGILKVDCLALGMLSAIRRGLELIAQHDQRALTLATIPAEDPAVYEMIGRADTLGVFQIESRAQMSMLPRLKPREFYDLVIEVAIVRPGPIQGNMVHPYLRRRCGDEQVTYPSEEVRSVLQKTLGVPIFQEQAMRLAVVAAGFTPGEADQLRRAMGAWRKKGVIDQFREKLLQGMLARGYDEEFAGRLFDQLRGFGEYGFPESHAASFALLVYVSAWMKCYYPAMFLAAILNSQPMGFYAPAQLVTDARQHGVEVYPVDVNESDWDCTLEACQSPVADAPGQACRTGRWAVRLGWRMVEGLAVADAEQVVRQRAAGPYRSYEELVARTGFKRRTLEVLAAADAFGSLGKSRRHALWQALAEREARPLFVGLEDDVTPPLPVMGDSQQVIADYQSTGLSLRAHPFAFLRDRLNGQGVVTTAALQHAPPDRRYRVAGLVLLRQRPSTAKGITFMTLEDETGTTNLIVRLEIWERYHRVARRAGALLATGKLQRQHGVIHVLVERLEDFSDVLPELASQSRDFR